MRILTVFCLSIGLSMLLVQAQELQTAPTGVQYEVVKAGTGASPAIGMELELNNTIYDAEGKKLFSTLDMGSPTYILMEESDDASTMTITKTAMVMKTGGTYRMHFPLALLNDPSLPKDLPGDHLVYEVELLSVHPPKPSGTKLLMEAALDGGAQAVQTKYTALLAESPDGYTFRQSDINIAGYQLMEKKKLEEAIIFFQLNLRLYPSSANAYDSMGDAYAAAGNVVRAKGMYERALQLAPEFPTTQEKLDQLGQ
jgi:tetratricopeptide (TPR) repeat protein